MSNIHDLGTFFLSAVILNLTPGQDTFYLLGRTMSQGRSAGVASALGISTGAVIHTLIAAIGISAVVATSPVAFACLKYVGAAYLCYLGIRMLRLHGMAKSELPSAVATVSLLAIYRQGALTNLLNPKIALFFLAFLPQFVVSDSPTRFLAFLTLGFCFVATSTVWALCLVGLSSMVTGFLQAESRATQRLNQAAGIAFIALGIRLATAQK